MPALERKNTRAKNGSAHRAASHVFRPKGLKVKIPGRAKQFFLPPPAILRTEFKNVNSIHSLKNVNRAPPHIPSPPSQAQCAGGLP